MRTEAALVAIEAQRLSLARALGPHWRVLMRGHGAAAAEWTLQERVFCCIYGARNAEAQHATRQLGAVRPLAPGKAEAATTQEVGAYDWRQYPLGRAAHRANSSSCTSTR